MPLALGLAAAALLSACSGGGSSSPYNGSIGVSGPPAANVASIIVDVGPNCTASEATTYHCTAGQPIGTANIAFVTVNVCLPGTSTCQSIDHVMVDTGSSGLRIMSSALGGGITLPAVQINSQPLVECAQFADGYTWGSVRTADVQVGGEIAKSVNVQVIGDSGATAPSSATSCVDTNLPALNDSYSFGANGVLGVGLFINDCLTGGTCPIGPGFYFSCSSSTNCNEVAVPSNQQVSNPTASLATDNTGVIVELPTVASGGSTDVAGSLVFGINTQSNNAMSQAQTVYAANSYTGNFFSTINSVAVGPYTAITTPWPNSFIDSGSNGIFLPGTTIPCDPTYGWFIPANTVSVPAIIQGELSTNPPATAIPAGTATSINFQIANATSLSGTAFNDLGAPTATCNSNGTGNGTSNAINGGIDWGLPLFFGKNVYVALETKTITVMTTNYTGPFWAF
ncbi:MAG TPA: DUF3443 family protein [Burkholderiaceae bacterium]|nr:DUF3443 family protein [Burkholderiaceae bacterium]